MRSSATPPAGTQCADVAYADDTALLSNDIQRLQYSLDRLIMRAQMYGLEPNWGKTVHLQIRHNSDIFTPQGAPVKVVSSAVYLGSLLREDGNTGASIARRVGEARGAFESLKTVWKHANITRQRKLYLFNACVVTKLTYSLEALCLRQADRDKIDAFQAQCLRKIFGVPHSMISRVSNEAVRNMSRHHKISSRVLYNQLVYFDKLASASDTNLLRSYVCQKGSSA